MLVEAVLLTLLLLLLRSWWHSCSPGKKRPPGPTIFPIIGSKCVFTAEDARKMKQKYGSIVRTRAGVSEMTLLCDYKLIKEAFLRFEFTDRPSMKSMHYITDGRPAGVFLTNGLQWQNARRFLLRNLRDLGMGKSQMDEAIQEEAKMLVQDFQNYDGKATTAPKSINVAVLNVIWQLVANRRNDLHDPEIHNFIELMKSLQEDTTNIVLPDLFPIINYLPSVIRDWIIKKAKLQTVVRKAKTVMKDIIASHKASLDKTNPRDVIDEYLLEMEKKDSQLNTFFCEEDLLKNIFDLFIAGFDTTSSTLRWLFLYMAAYPEVQKKVQEEIDGVVPRGTLPSHLHKSQLPYLEATLHEILRKSSLIPFAVGHATNQDTQIGGYFLPKGTVVLGCSVLAHEDPQYWPQPHEFRPDRFLDTNGKFVSQKEGFIPFGIGKRQCLGESLARMEIFIFSAALLQNFTFSAPPGKTMDLSPAAIPFLQSSKDQDILITIRK